MDLKKVIFKCKALPIIDGTFCSDGNNIITTDLENVIIIKHSHPVGVWRGIQNAYDIAEFPKVRFIENYVGDITTEDFENILYVNRVAGKDELRPVMMGVCFDEETIVATDGQKMLWLPFPKLFSNNVVLDFRPIQTKLNYLLKYFKPTGFKVYESEKNVRFETDNFSVTLIKIDGKFPQWRNSLPNVLDYQVCLDIPMALMEQIHKDFNEIKFIDKDALPILKINFDGSMYLEYEGIRFDYKADILAQTLENPSYLIMPTMVDTNKGDFAININFIINKTDIELYWLSPSRALYIKEPLMQEGDYMYNIIGIEKPSNMKYTTFKGLKAWK